MKIIIIYGLDVSLLRNWMIYKIFIEMGGNFLWFIDIISIYIKFT